MERNLLKIGIFQMLVTENVQQNVEKAVAAIRETKKQQPKLKLAILPESFNAPYGNEFFAKYAEQVPEGYTCQALSKLAKELQIYIIGGSIIERAKDGNLYNTCSIWQPSGELAGVYRKMHLFHVDIKAEHEGGVQFNEALTLTAGSELTIIEIGQRKIGIGICHDKRFEELARLYRIQGCDMLIYPSAFCICQGPLHWELLQRSRANDNQLFVVTCSPARDNMSGYVAYGHSMIVDPWGRVQREAGTTETVLVDDIDFTQVDEVRAQIPIFKQRRIDLYGTKLL